MVLGYNLFSKLFTLNGVSITKPLCVYDYGIRMIWRLKHITVSQLSYIVENNNIATLCYVIV